MRPRDPEEVAAALQLARREGLRRDGLLGRAQLGRQPPARRGAADRPRGAGLRAGASRRRRAPWWARAAPAPSCSASLARHELFFPVGHCNGVAVGGYLLQGGLRLERARPRPGLHERRGDRRGHRRRRAAASRRRAPQRAAVGGPWIGPRLLRGRDRLSPAPLSAAEGGGQRALHLPHGRARGPLPLGGRRSGPRCPAASS